MNDNSSMQIDADVAEVTLHSKQHLTPIQKKVFHSVVPCDRYCALSCCHISILSFQECSIIGAQVHVKARLAELHNKDLKGAFDRQRFNPEHGYYIGLTRRANARPWKWASGRKLRREEIDWGAPPFPGGEEFCAFVHLDLGWFSTKCNEGMYGICEYRPRQHIIGKSGNKNLHLQILTCQYNLVLFYISTVGNE